MQFEESLPQLPVGERLEARSAPLALRSGVGPAGAAGAAGGAHPADDVSAVGEHLDLAYAGRHQVGEPFDCRDQLAPLMG
jgi:hypothetical protein